VSPETKANSAMTSASSAQAAARFQRELVALIPHLRAFSRVLCGRRAIAEDLAQEALAKAWRARERFELGTNLKAWLFTILRNEFYSHARRAWRETHWDDDLGDNIPAPPREQEWAMELSDAARALNALPDCQRPVLRRSCQYLRHARGYDEESGGARPRGHDKEPRGLKVTASASCTPHARHERRPSGAVERSRAAWRKQRPCECVTKLELAPG
jgi:RNA polymerase sigma factor (sigma-70 family)